MIFWHIHKLYFSLLIALRKVYFKRSFNLY
nr:MAG TPA: hypothetical protein [Bacteriophage sp.]